MYRIKEYTNPSWGYAFKRISKAFREYSPDWVEWVNNDKYDLKLVHVVGGEEIPFLQKDLDKTIIIQHCYYTTYYDKWDQFWKDALLTVSFHNLIDYTTEKFNFYRMPWGADPKIFYYDGEEKYLDIFVTGHVAETESINEIFEAVKRTNKVMVHTGHNFKFGSKNYRYLEYMPDYALRKVLANTRYVAGLRKIEGFELSCVEGLFCGAVPIVYDLPTYSFYEGLAIFINPNVDVVEQLVHHLSNPVSLSYEQYKEAVNRFSWQNIMGGFYNILWQKLSTYLRT